MSHLKDTQLRRFWFPAPGYIGLGVSAYTREEAETLARETALRLGWTFEIGAVIEDVDIRTLDQGHVIPNMGPPTFHGVWYPRLNIE